MRAAATAAQEHDARQVAAVLERPIRPQKHAVHHDHVALEAAAHSAHVDR